MRFIGFLCAFFLPLSASADSVSYIKRPDVALAAYGSLLKSAKQSIDLVTFIFEPCHASTQLFMETLEAKARAGVRVRVLLDAFSQSHEQKAELAAYFQRAGIQFRWYNETGQYDPLSTFRIHAKLVVVDGAAYYSGSRNLSDDYFGLLEGLNFSDADLLVSGGSAKEASAAFALVWNAKPSTLPKAVDASFRDWASACKGKADDGSRRVAGVRAFLSREGKALLASAPARSCSHVGIAMDDPRFLNPLPGVGGDPAWDLYMTPSRLQYKKATKNFLDFAEGTKRALEIENWSYMPYYYLEKAFLDLRTRGVVVPVITNAEMDGSPWLEGSEEALQQRAVLRDNRDSETVVQLTKRGSLSDGYALTPPGAYFRLHTKAAVRDGQDVLVGTFNLDPRSYGTNVEDVVQVQGCRALAADVQAEFSRLRRVYLKDQAAGIGPDRASPSFLSEIISLVGANFL